MTRRPKPRHSACIAQRDDTTRRFHGRSYSYTYGCPRCGRRARFNANFLGTRAVVCNGRTFYRVRLARVALVLEQLDAGMEHPLT